MTRATATYSRGRSGGGPPLARRLVRVFGPELDPGEAVLLDGPLRVGRAPGDAGLELPDGAASRVHAELRPTPEGVELTDQGSKNGTFLNGRRTERAALGDGAVLRIGGSLFVLEVGPPAPPGRDPSASLARRRVGALARRAAPTDAPVLVTGPTGAGKERLAQLVHEASGRPGALVAVNCANLNPQLVGSELFGHRAGAFSGADRDRAGLLATADGGTLFLDEVADLPLDLQPALLRVLEEGRFRPVGADAEVAVDVRVVSATHLDPEAMVGEGRFRTDLYGRLAGVELALPGLAERRVEILPLLSGFAPGLELHVEAAERLLLYGWPRNIRELKHLATQLSLTMEGPIHAETLPERIRDGAEAAEDSKRTPSEPPAPVDAPAPPPTREALEALMSEHRGRVTAVARRLGRSRQAVYRLLEDYGLDPAAFRPS